MPKLKTEGKLMGVLVGYGVIATGIFVGACKLAISVFEGNY